MNEAAFVLTVYNDRDLAWSCLKSLREFYPTETVIVVSDGDMHEDWINITGEFSALFHYGKRLMPIVNGAEYTKRILEFARNQADVIFRIDTDTRFHRKLSNLPKDCVFGRLQECGELKSIQGGCTGIANSVIDTLLNDKLFDELKNPKVYSQCKEVLQRTNVYKLMSWDWSLGWLCQQTNVPVVNHPEVGCYWKKVPLDTDNDYAVTHPHKKPWHNRVMIPVPPKRIIKTNEFSLDELEYNWLVEFIKFMKVKTVLEFGPGLSTNAFLEAGCNVDSYESMPEFLAKLEQEHAGNLNLKLRKYDNVPEVVIEDGFYDLALVDAPAVYIGHPHAQRYARRNTMNCAIQHSNLVLIHDSNREPEKSIIRETVAKGWTAHNLCPSKRGLTILTKNDQKETEVSTTN